MMGSFEICVVPPQGGPVVELVPARPLLGAQFPHSLFLRGALRAGRNLSLLDVPTKTSQRCFPSFGK